MLNDGNGTCYDKTTYQSFISQHDDDYVFQVKEGGSASNPTQIDECANFTSSPKNFQMLKNKGGYAVKSGAQKCGASNITTSYAIIIVMILHLSVI